MAAIPITDQIVNQLRKLTPDQQQKVLDFTLNLMRPRGEPGIEIIRHARELDFPLEDLAEIQHIIEEDCETINPNEWELPA